MTKCDHAMEHDFSVLVVTFFILFPGGYKIPAGCMINIPIYHIHRNPKQWPSPHSFDPDNFLPNRVAERHPYAYVPFSAGPRNCIGMSINLDITFKAKSKKKAPRMFHVSYSNACLL